MAACLFPDNTVLCNFAAVERLDLLKTVLDGRGRWTTAVAVEARRSALTLPALEMVPVEGWLGEPIEIDDFAEIHQVDQIRRKAFGGTRKHRTKHLGEAESCYVIQNWASFAGSEWISDDRDALRYARKQGIPTRETIDLMRAAVACDCITFESAFALMLHMSACDRHPRLPKCAADLK